MTAGPYRTHEAPRALRAEPRRWIRPLCWLIGHRWVEIRVNVSKAVALAAFHRWAGSDCDCTRCGATWRDA